VLGAAATASLEDCWLCVIFIGCRDDCECLELELELELELAVAKPLMAVGTKQRRQSSNAGLNVSLMILPSLRSFELAKAKAPTLWKGSGS